MKLCTKGKAENMGREENSKDKPLMKSRGLSHEALVCGEV